MRLIDADKLVERMATVYTDTDLRARYTEIMRAIMEQPTVDAVPVMRCSECRYCFDEDRETPYDGESWWYCERWDKETNAYGTDPYRFYCADGERREEDGDGKID